MATFVICHGAWSAAWAWKKVRPLLRAAGHEIFTPTYTGLGERAHQVSRSINLETHIADVLAVLDCEDLRDVVLVGHSYGGMVATGVADRAAERIAKLIYLDAFVPDNGQSLFDLLPASAACVPAGGLPARRRRLASAAQSAAAGYLARRYRLDHTAAALAADRDFHAAACPQGRRRTSAAQLHLLHAHRAGRHIRPVRAPIPVGPGLEAVRNRCQPQPERHGARTPRSPAGPDCQMIERTLVGLSPAPSRWL